MNGKLRIENRAGIQVLVGGGWCRPATKAEIEFYKERNALKTRIAAWERCAEPFEITDPVKFEEAIKKLMDEPGEALEFLDKCVQERDALKKRVIELEASETELSEKIGREHKEVKQYSKAMEARVKELEKELSQPPAYQEIAIECLETLRKAGLGKPGTPNTLWAMTRQACKRIKELEKILLDFIVCRGTDTERMSDILDKASDMLSSE